MPRIRCSTSSRSKVESTAWPASYRTAILFMVQANGNVPGTVGQVPKVTSTAWIVARQNRPDTLTFLGLSSLGLSSRAKRGTLAFVCSGSSAGKTKVPRVARDDSWLEHPFYFHLLAVRINP